MSKVVVILVLISVITFTNSYLFKVKVDTTKCPVVKAMRNFDLNQLLGQWYVVQYYASSEEDLSYKCMRAEFTEADMMASSSNQIEVTMNFTYAFISDPDSKQLLGNITWQMPDPGTPAHWVHAEDTYEGVYNTYVLDTDYQTWTLLMHCAEKEKSTRYLSAFIMSRGVTLPHNVISYLRDKLPKYGIDLQFMFDMTQDNCDRNTSEYEYGTSVSPSPSVVSTPHPRRRGGKRRHPLKRVHKNSLNITMLSDQVKAVEFD